MSRQIPKKKPRKKAGPSKLVQGAVLLVLLAVAAKVTPLLEILGFSSSSSVGSGGGEALQRKSYDLDEALAQQRAEAKLLAERRALQRAMEEADRKRSHDEQLAMNAAEEAAFMAWYKPSPECVNKGGKWSTAVKCGNEYIAAKKYFLEHRPKPGDPWPGH